MAVTVNLFWVIVVCAIVVLFYFLKECFFKDKDTSITTGLIDKFPLVSPEFYKKTKTEQLAENNQEIHEINKRIDKLEVTFEELNKNIQKQLDAIIEELGKRG
jgi:septal ring factor EnvC (AmiA/AmiB activator)